MSHATTYPPMDLPSRHLDTGRVWRATSDTFSQAARRFILLGVAPVPVAVIAAIPALLAQGNDYVSEAIALALLCVALLLLGVGQNAVVYGAGRLLDGEDFELKDAVAVGVERLPHLVGAWVLSSIVVLLGLALLIVPGLVALVALSLVGSATVLERRSPIAAIRRSVGLAKGSLWRIVGAAGLVVGVPLAAVIVVGGTLVGVFYAMHTEFSLVVSASVAAIFAIVSLTLFPAIYMVLLCVLFVELRHLKDGA